MTEKRPNHRKVLQGVVVKTQPKTIKVLVERYKIHPLYKKRFKVSTNYQVHDQMNEASVGDLVTIAETRKFSKTKTFRLLKIKESTKGQKA